MQHARHDRLEAPTCGMKHSRGYGEEDTDPKQEIQFFEGRVKSSYEQMTRNSIFNPNHLLRGTLIKAFSRFFRQNFVYFIATQIKWGRQE